VSFAAVRGARYRTTLTVERAGTELRVNAAVSGDGFAEFVREYFVLLLHGAAPDAGTLDGVTITGRDGRFEIPNGGAGFTFSCRVSG
jgi:hypothetical protein